MKKLNKKFGEDNFTIESMACAVTCGCSCGTNYCQCNNTSDYYGYTETPNQTNYRSIQNALDKRVETETYEFHA